jgi:hypothetical protein
MHLGNDNSLITLAIDLNYNDINVEEQKLLKFKYLEFYPLECSYILTKGSL